jgi:hypothetical protein
MRLRRGETVPAQKNPQHRLRVCPSGWMIICAVLTSLSAIPLPIFPRNAARSAAGAQIIANGNCSSYESTATAHRLVNKVNEILLLVHSDT